MAASYFMMKMIRKKQNKIHSKTDNNANLNMTTNTQKCRICLKDGNIPIYGENSDLPLAIKTFGEVEINEDDQFPKYLCEHCQSLLNAAILFRKSAKQSDEILHSTSVYYNYDSDIQETNSVSEDFTDQESKKDLHKCIACNLLFKTAEGLSIHKLRKNHKKVRVQCNICQRLVTPKLYKRHLLRHQSASHLVCEICGKLSRKDNLLRHLQLHTYELPFQCQQCPYRGRFMESLKIHMRTHSGIKPFSCDNCNLRFITRSNLNKHLLTHKKEKPHKCIECGRGFYTKHDMDLHYKADHAGIKDFSCKICGNKYGTRKAIMRHELRVHKRDKMAKGRMPLYLQEEYKNLN